MAAPLGPEVEPVEDCRDRLLTGLRGRFARDEIELEELEELEREAARVLAGERDGEREHWTYQ